MANPSNILQPQPRWAQKFARHTAASALTDEIRNIYRILNLLGRRVPLAPGAAVGETPAEPSEPWVPPTDHQMRYFFVVPIEWHSGAMDFAWPITPDIPGGTAWRVSQLDLWLIASDHTGQGCLQTYDGGYSEWWFELRARGTHGTWFVDTGASPIYPEGYGTPSAPYLGWWQHQNTSVSQSVNPYDPTQTYWLNKWFQTLGGGAHYFQLRGHGWAGDPDADPVCSLLDPACCYLAVLTGFYEMAPAFFPFGDICPFDPYV